MVSRSFQKSMTALRSGFPTIAESIYLEAIVERKEREVDQQWCWIWDFVDCGGFAVWWRDGRWCVWGVVVGCGGDIWKAINDWGAVVAVLGQKIGQRVEVEI